MISYYVIDAFSKQLFHGNPAGVCILENPLSEQIMQQIAFENNLAETAFVFQEGKLLKTGGRRFHAVRLHRKGEGRTAQHHLRHCRGYVPGLGH